MATNSRSLPAKLSKQQLATEKAAEQQLQKFEETIGDRDTLAHFLLNSSDPKAAKLGSALLKATNRKKSLLQVINSIRFNPKNLYEAVKSGAEVVKTGEASLAIFDSLLETVRVTAESAQKVGPEGYKDRELLFKLSGMLDTGPGVQVNLQQNIGAVGKEGIFEKLTRESSALARGDPFIEAEFEEIEDV